MRNNHVKKIIFSAIFVVLLFQNAFSQVDTASLAQLTLRELLNVKVTTASKTAEMLERAAATVIVITEEQIKIRGYQSLLDLVYDLPDMKVDDKIYGGIRNSITVRGTQGQEKFVILLDGMRISSPSGEAMPIMENYPVNLAEQVEIVYGPASALYGADAVSGVINIITKKASSGKGFHVNASSVAGSYGYTNTSLFITKKLTDHISLVVSGQYSYDKQPDYSKLFKSDSLMSAASLSPGTFNTIYGPFTPNKAVKNKYEAPLEAYNIYVALHADNFAFAFFRNYSKIPTSYGANTSNAVYNKEVYVAQSINMANASYKKSVNKITLTSLLSANEYKLNPKSNYRNLYTAMEPAYKYSICTMIKGEEQVDFKASDKLSITAGAGMKALSGETFVQEIHFPGSEHHPESWSETNFNPIYDGVNITGIACYSRDTTASRNFKNKLIDINKKLETAQQIASLGYWELNMDIDTLYWSDQVYNIWGVSPDTFEVSFKNFYKTIYPKDRKLFDEAQKSALDGKTKMDIEYRIILPSGKVKYVHENGELVYNDDGKKIRFEGTVQDITKRKELEYLLNKASKLAQIGSWEMDLIKGTVYWSEVTKEIHETNPGYMPDLSAGVNFYKEGKSRDLITQKVQDAIENGKPWDLELQIITAKENEKWIRSIGETEFINGKCVKISGSFQDITILKRSEIHLWELNQNLRKQAKELALSNAELEQFAYVASHDLQEPLRMITSFLTMLDKKYGDVIDDKGKKYIGFAVDGAKRMRQIILDLLEFSRVGGIEDELEEVDLNELLKEIKLLFKKQTGEKGAFIQSEILPVIYAHKTSLRQVFQNLVSNAIKYRKKDIAPQIYIRVKELKDHWKFSIADNGIGIEAEYYDKVFIIFQRLHAKEEFSGTGMGLAITKKIIESNGGKIWVNSEINKGSTFYFTLLKR